MLLDALIWILVITCAGTAALWIVVFALAGLTAIEWLTHTLNTLRAQR